MAKKIYKRYIGTFFSPFMRFSHCAVFPRKQIAHKQRTKCILVPFRIMELARDIAATIM